METALKHWMFHVDCPHSRSEWVSETSQMMHDNIFWVTVAVVAFTVLFVGLVLWSMVAGTPMANPTTYMPISLPIPYLMQ